MPAVEDLTLEEAIALQASAANDKPDGQGRQKGRSRSKVSRALCLPPRLAWPDAAQ
jgi:hypothetical protein